MALTLHSDRVHRGRDKLGIYDDSLHLVLSTITFYGLELISARLSIVFRAAPILLSFGGRMGDPEGIERAF